MKNSDYYNPKQQLQILTIWVMMKALNREKKTLFPGTYWSVMYQITEYLHSF